MPVYQISAPNGKIYEIEGPEGASQEEVIAQVTKQYPEATTPLRRSAAERFVDTASEAFAEFSPMAAIGRGLSTYDPTLSDPDERARLGPDGETIARGERTTEQSRLRRERIGARETADPIQQEGDAWYDPGTIGRALTSFGGEVLGGAPGDPSSLLGFGKSIAAQALSQAGIGAGVDALLQGTEIGQGVRDEYSPEQTLVSGAAGGALTGAVGLAGRQLSKWFPEGQDLPSASPDAPVGAPTSVRMPQDVRNDIISRIDAGQTVEDIAAAHPMWMDVPGNEAAVNWYVQNRSQGGKEPIVFGAEDAPIDPNTPEGRLQQEAQAFQQGKQEPTPEDLWPSEETVRAREQALEERLTQEADAWKNRDQALPEATPETIPARVQEVVNEVDSVIGQWKTDPDITVVSRTDQIDDPSIQARIEADGATGAKGVTLEDGRIFIIADNLTDPSDVKAVLYHEALGHKGMSTLFRERLDGLLSQIYDSTPDFKEKVDDWLARNPGAYLEAPNRVARAADEVLAEMSEGGPMTATLINRIKNYVKMMARRARMKDVEFSDREIRTILAMAHDAMIKGKNGDVVSNGYRYAMPRDIMERDRRLRNEQRRVNEEEDRRAAERAGVDPESIGLPPKYGSLSGKDIKRKGPRYSNKPDPDSNLGKWFEDSKVVDQQGAPLTVYHGTSADKDFSSFKMKDRGIWFTEDSESASSYAIDNDSKRIVRDPNGATPWATKVVNTASRVFPVYLAIKNPKVYVGRELADATYAKGGENYARGEAALFRELRSQGYDGVKVELEPGKNIWVVLGKPSQIKSATGNVGTFDPTKSDVRYANGKKFSTSPESMRTVNDLDDVLTVLGKEAEGLSGGPRSIRELERTADDLGLTASKYLRGKSLEDQNIAAQVLGAKQLLTNTVEELAQLGEKARVEGMTPTLRANIAGKLAIARAIYAKFDGDTSEAGRTLRVLREVSESRRSGKALMRFMDENQSNIGHLSDDALVDSINIITKTEGPEAGARAINKARKLHWEDYAGSVVYNSMLSSPVTWVKNFLGSPMNFLTDLVVDSTASAVSKALPKGADRITSAEIGARLFGPLDALRSWKTYQNIGNAFYTGRSRNPGFEGKVGSSGPVFKGPVSAVVEGPTRIMSGVDEIWSNLFFQSNFAGEVVRSAIRSGKTGKALKDEIARLRAEPTPEILKQAQDTTNRQLFRDTPSGVGQTLLDVLTPRFDPEVELRMVEDPTTGKMRATSYIKRTPDSQGKRVAKFAGRLAVPFVPTLDSIARTIIRNSGPLALFSGEIRRDLMTPGIKRQSALSRIGVASASLGYFGYLASEGLMTGIEGDPWKEGQARSAVKPPMSIKIGDEWVSYAGFDPIAGQMAAAATIVERSEKTGEVISSGNLGALVAGMAETLVHSSYAESLLNTLKMVEEGRQLVQEGETPGSDTGNFVAGQAANVMNPAFVRWVNQEFLDPAARDTSAEGDVVSRALARVQAGTPGLSEGLPQKHDVFGRPMETMRQERMVETDPTILEINRLEEKDNKIVLGPVDRTIYKNTDYQTKLNSEQYELYQSYSGSWAVEDITAAMADPEWETLTDEERIDRIKKIRDDARKQARDQLFPLTEE